METFAEWKDRMDTVGMDEDLRRYEEKLKRRKKTKDLTYAILLGLVAGFVVGSLFML